MLIVDVNKQHFQPSDRKEPILANTQYISIVYTFSSYFVYLLSFNFTELSIKMGDQEWVIMTVYRLLKCINIRRMFACIGTTCVGHFLDLYIKSVDIYFYLFKCPKHCNTIHKACRKNTKRKEVITTRRLNHINQQQQKSCAPNLGGFIT